MSLKVNEISGCIILYTFKSSVASSESKYECLWFDGQKIPQSFLRTLPVGSGDNTAKLWKAYLSVHEKLSSHSWPTSLLFEAHRGKVLLYKRLVVHFDE